MSDDENRRIRELEAYTTAHEAQIMAWWQAQWAANADVEKRMRDLERWQQRAMGVVLSMSLVGSIMGSALIMLLFGARA